MSTMGVAGSCTTHNTKVLFSEDDLYVGQNYEENVHVKSKFMEERGIFDAMKEGMLVSIYRIGHLTGRYQDGRYQLNIEDNTFYNMLKSIIQIGAIPEAWSNGGANFTPVDVCDEAVVKLISSPHSINQSFHLQNTNEISYGSKMR